MAHSRETTIHTLDPKFPDPAILQRAAEILRRGGLVAFPTETVYGLGANALDPNAVAGIYVAKGRPAHNPLIVHIADMAAAQELAEWNREAEILATRFWAGPLTLVLPKKSPVPDIVTGGGATVALRIPAHPVAIALLKASGLPLAAPSANRSNQLSPTLAKHVAQGLWGRIDMILDGGAAWGGVESTVISLAESPPRLLRPGLVTPSEIEAALGRRITQDRPKESADKAPLPSPGMLLRHYAPRTPLVIAEGDGEPEIERFLNEGLRVGWLTFEPQEPRPNLITTLMPQEAHAYAARLFAALHELDSGNLDRVVAAKPPQGEAWLAVQDRLTRASA